jgi:hypothetical protein
MAIIYVLLGLAIYVSPWVFLACLIDKVYD